MLCIHYILDNFEVCRIQHAEQSAVCSEYITCAVVCASVDIETTLELIYIHLLFSSLLPLQ